MLNQQCQKIIGIGREVLVRRKNGTVFPAELAVSEVNVQGQRMFTGILRDVSERKEAEKRILESNQELERFAYVASHDLKEPLRKIQTYCEFLQRKCKDELSEEGHTYIKRMTSAADRMKNLINDLLEYSRISRREKPFTDMDTQTLLDKVLGDLEVRIREAHATVTLTNLPPLLFGDETQLSQVFQNLIANALKFHRENVPTEINIFGGTIGPQWIEICVQDNGIGLEDEYKEQIFEVFQRLHERGKYEGTGIGLSICKKIIECHGGTINVASVLGQGSTFTVRLPKSNTEVTEKIFRRDDNGVR